MELHHEENYWWDLFSWKELELLINLRPLMSTDRVVLLHSKKGYEWNLDTWSTQDSVPASVIKEVLETGFLYIKEASRFTRKINELAKEIEKEYGYQTDAHIYATLNPDLPHPLGAHIDDNDNVIVQCEGATNWKVWDKMDVIPDSRKDWVNLDLDKSPALDVTLLPGDAVWIPKYYPHLATSEDDRLSVSFPSRGDKGVTFQDREWLTLDKM